MSAAERVSPRYARIVAGDRIKRAYGDPLQVLASLMVQSSGKLQLDAAKALAPYLYPMQKAVELSGPDGDKLEVRIVKYDGISPDTSPQAPSAPSAECTEP